MKTRYLKALAAAGLLTFSTAVAAESPDAPANRGTSVPPGFVSMFRSQIGMAARRSGNDAQFRSASGTASYNCAHAAPGGDRIIRYPFSVPDSRGLGAVTVWGLKGPNTQDLRMRVYRSCLSQTELVPVTQTLSTTTLTTNPGQFVRTLTIFGETPQSLNCKYWVDIQFGDSTAACADSPLDLRIYKIRVESFAPDWIFQDRFVSHTSR